MLVGLGAVLLLIALATAPSGPSEPGWVEHEFWRRIAGTRVRCALSVAALACVIVGLEAVRNAVPDWGRALAVLGLTAAALAWRASDVLGGLASLERPARDYRDEQRRNHRRAAILMLVSASWTVVTAVLLWTATIAVVASLRADARPVHGDASGAMTLRAGVALLWDVCRSDPGAHYSALAGLLSWLVAYPWALSSAERWTLSLLPRAPDEALRLARIGNVVEEMRIAAGLPDVQLRVIEDPSPNAFAVGRPRSGATVVVTTRLLDLLDRDQLQAVVAHEIGHLRSDDIRFVTVALLTVWFHLALVAISGIALVAVVGVGVALICSVAALDGDADLGGCVVVLIAVILGFCVLAYGLAIVLPYTAVSVTCLLVTALLASGVSKRREFVADATAVELTRDPEALASALELIASAPRGQTSRLGWVAPLCVHRPPESGSSGGRLGYFATWTSILVRTHPHTAVRIRRLRSMRAGAAGPARRSQGADAKEVRS
jgi:heat shock protein HtpX